MTLTLFYYRDTLPKPETARGATRRDPKKVSFNVNGTSHTVDADPDMPLLYALRNDVGLNNPLAAEIANAIFDATGVRIRRVPFSPERVKAALS